MKDPTAELRFVPAVAEAEPDEAEADGPEHDPFYYGWRPSREQSADGEEHQRWIPLTYQDRSTPKRVTSSPRTRSTAR